MAGGELADVYARFEGLEGECMDAQHPGSAGWIALKGFSFSCGPGDVTATEEEAGAGNRSGGRTGSGAGTAPTGSTQTNTRGGANNRSPSRAATGNQDFPNVTINKIPDLMSTGLLQTNLHNGEPIPTVEVVACRYGGNSTDDERVGYKIPFLRLKFTGVRITNISIALSDDAMPTERLTFRYETVQIETVWTDNETGDRVPGGTQRIRWDVEAGNFVTPTESD